MNDQADAKGPESEEQGRFSVDEDWKKSVQEEKGRLREQGEEEEGTKEQQAQQPLPEVDFQVFMAGLYTQTLVAMGLLKNPATGEQKKNLREAQFLIDTIDMLKERTTGNLSNEEEEYLGNLIYDLKMRYVNAARDTSGSGGAGSGE